MESGGRAYETNFCCSDPAHSFHAALRLRGDSAGVLRIAAGILRIGRAKRKPWPDTDGSGEPDARADGNADPHKEADGKTDGKLEVVKKGLANGIDEETISILTGFSIDQIKNIKRKL